MKKVTWRHPWRGIRVSPTHGSAILGRAFIAAGDAIQGIAKAQQLTYAMAVAQLAQALHTAAHMNEQ